MVLTQYRRRHGRWSAVRFVSAEPLLGPLDLTKVGNLESCRSAFPSVVADEVRHMAPHVINGFQIDALGKPYQSTAYFQTPDHMGGFAIGTRRWPRLDWVIAGGESGPGARPMHPDWARSLRDQCAEASLDFHFKQWGEWAPTPGRAHFKEAFSDEWRRVDSLTPGVRPALMSRIGKSSAGRLLDGIEHNAMPEVPSW